MTNPVPAATSVPTPAQVAAATTGATPAPNTPTAPATGRAETNGYPANTPLEQMTDAQRAEYWKHYARKHEDKVNAYGELTPQQVKELQAKLDALEADKLTADERALKDARKEAADAAATAARAELQPKLQAAEVRGIAGPVIQGDQLKAFMALVSGEKGVSSAVLGENGEVDEAKVMGLLTAMYGQAPAGQQQSGPRWQNAGQYSPPPPAGRPGGTGRAEAQRRFGGNKPTT